MVGALGEQTFALGQDHIMQALHGCAGSSTYVAKFKQVRASKKPVTNWRLWCDAACGVMPIES